MIDEWCAKLNKFILTANVKVKKVFDSAQKFIVS